MQIYEFDQGSDDWRMARLGLPTASEFHTIMAKGKDGGASVTRRTYMMKLAGELITGEPSENYTNAHMQRGTEQEDQIRRDYCFVHEIEARRVGFITNGKPGYVRGASPDALIGEDGVLEIKSKLPHLMVELYLKDEFPPEHRAQCQGALWVTEREWVDLAVGYPGMKLFLKRARRDEAYIAMIDAAVRKFNDELHEIVERAKRYGGVAA